MAITVDCGEGAHEDCNGVVLGSVGIDDDRIEFESDCECECRHRHLDDAPDTSHERMERELLDG